MAYMQVYYIIFRSILTVFLGGQFVPWFCFLILKASLIFRRRASRLTAFEFFVTSVLLNQVISSALTSTLVDAYSLFLEEIFLKTETKIQSPAILKDRLTDTHTHSGEILLFLKAFA